MTDSGIVHALTPGGCGTKCFRIGYRFIFPNLTYVSSALPHIAFRSTMVACYSSVHGLIKVRDVHLGCLTTDTNYIFCGGIEERGRLEVLRMFLALM